MEGGSVSSALLIPPCRLLVITHEEGHVHSGGKDTRTLRLLRTLKGAQFSNLLNELWRFHGMFFPSHPIKPAVLQDLHDEYLREMVQECYELFADYEGKHDPNKLDELGSVMTSLDPGDSIVVAKAFSHMLNLAEEVQIAF